MPHANSFRELEVYQLARKLARRIYQLSKEFPKEELYSLTNQIRRSSRSVGAQIAEAWAKRLYKKHFVSKLTDAEGEQFETEHWIETLGDCELLDTATVEELIKEYERLGRMLYTMRSKAALFCKPIK
jgi:four helix bundle protein